MIFVAIIVSQLRLLLNFWNLLGVRHIKLYVVLNCHIRLPFIYIVDIDEHSKYNISIGSIDSPQSNVTRERFFYDEIVIVQRDIEKRIGYGEIIVQYYALKENKVGIKFAKKFCKLVKQKIFKPIKK